MLKNDLFTETVLKKLKRIQVKIKRKAKNEDIDEELY